MKMTTETECGNEMVIGTAMMRHASFEEMECPADSCELRLEEAGRLIEDAAARRCDILCLPELFADPSQGVHMENYAEEPGGPVCGWLAEQAKKHDMAIVTSVGVREGERLTNSCLIYDRQGGLAGRYDKVHLPPGEREKCAPGTAFPVFDVSGVSIGMQICYDLNFPEGCRILSLHGAEIIFWPNMWGHYPVDKTDILMRARAIENGCILVSSAYLLKHADNERLKEILGRSCVVDGSGRVLAEVGERIGVAVAAVDVDELRMSRDKLPTRAAHRLPELYDDLSVRR